MLGSHNKIQMPSVEQALRGRDEAMQVGNQHFVNGKPIKPPFPANMRQALFGMGCFWGAERMFWQAGGVYSTAVGYAGGFTLNPNYEEVCSGRTGHNEVVFIAFDPQVISYKQLLTIFWESHNPTQGMQQGNDVGTQYRSAIYCFEEEQKQMAEASRHEYQHLLENLDYAGITTEILDAPDFYYAEEYHQQYLAKNPGGYCGLGGTGVCFSAD